MRWCVNCRMSLQADNQHHEYIVMDLSPDLVSITEEWCCREVKNNDELCQQCMNLVLQEAKHRNKDPDYVTSQPVPNVVCISCGVSLYERTGRRHHRLIEGSSERCIIENEIIPRLMPLDAWACAVCWSRAKKASKCKAQTTAPIEVMLVDDQDIQTDTKMAVITNTCIVCNVLNTEDVVFYNFSDISNEIPSSFDLKINGESPQDNDSLCESCFKAIVTKTIKMNVDSDTTTDEIEEPYRTYISVAEETENVDMPARCVWCRNMESSTLELHDGPVREEIAAIMYPKQISSKDKRVCKYCWIKIKRHFPKINKKRCNESNDVAQNIILKDYRRCGVKYCFVKGCKSGERRSVPKYLRKVLLEYYKLYVPPSGRGCSEHIKEYYRDWSFLKDLEYSDKFDSNDIEDMLCVMGDVKM